jgi:hypothetical protein
VSVGDIIGVSAAQPHADLLGSFLVEHVDPRAVEQMRQPRRPGAASPNLGEHARRDDDAAAKLLRLLGQHDGGRHVVSRAERLEFSPRQRGRPRNFRLPGQRHPVGVTVRVGEGRVLAYERGLDPDASAEAVGELEPWFAALIDQRPKRLRLDGDSRLARALVAECGKALFDESAPDAGGGLRPAPVGWPRMGTELQRWRVALVTAIAVAGLGLVVAGCGDDETNGEQTPDAGSPGAAQIEQFGSEAEGRERERIVAGFDAYMSALSAGDYKTACEHLTRQARGLLQRAGSKQGGGGCPQAISGFQGFAPQAADREIEKVRVEGETAQVIFSASDTEPQRTRMHREGGEWKAGLFSLPIRPPAS